MAWARLFPVHSIPYAPEPVQPPKGCNFGIFPDILKTYAELNRSILAQNMSGAYRVWLLCRALDPRGRGIVGLTPLLQLLDAHGLNRHLLRRVRKQSGCRTFLTFHATHIEYRSLEAVCRSLGVLPGRAVSIPTESIESTESFRAALYTAWIASHDDLHMSRERLSALFGISADTQRRWERLTGVEVTHNVIEVAKGDQEAAEAHIPKDARLDGDRLGRAYVWEYRGSLYYQSVNRYSAPHFERGCVGNVRKVSRAVRAAVPVEDHGDGTRRRVFYTERATPTNHQEKSGSCLRTQRQPIHVPHGLANLWRYSKTKPVARQEMLG